MAVSGQSTSYQNSINPFLKCLHGNQRIQFPGAGNFQNFDCWGILKPEAPGQVCSRIGTMGAAVSDDLKVMLIIFIHNGVRLLVFSHFLDEKILRLFPMGIQTPGAAVHEFLLPAGDP
jgi:hypothetical protein